MSYILYKTRIATFQYLLCLWCHHSS